MKVCFSWLAVLSLAVWNVGCGSSDPATPAAPAPSTDTELGAPGGIETGSGTAGMEMDTPAEDTPAEAETDGPVLPETTEE